MIGVVGLFYPFLSKNKNNEMSNEKNVLHSDLSDRYLS